jgi:hypothetical protein
MVDTKWFEFISCKRRIIWFQFSNRLLKIFEDAKGVIRSRSSKKDRQYNGQKKTDKIKTINGWQNTNVL